MSDSEKKVKNKKKKIKDKRRVRTAPAMQAITPFIMVDRIGSMNLMTDRFSVNNLEKYLKGERIESEEAISVHDILCEKIMLGMRLCRGVDFSSLDKQVLNYQKKLEAFISSGHVKRNGTSLSFTDEGMYVSNYILSEVLDFEN